MSATSSGDSPLFVHRSNTGLPVDPLAAHKIVVAPQTSAVTQGVATASVALWKPDRTRFLDFHLPIIEATAGAYDLSAFLRDFRSKRERNSWLQSFQADKGFSHVIGDLFAKASGYEGWQSFSCFETLYNMMSYYTDQLPIGAQGPFRAVLKMVSDSKNAIGDRPRSDIGVYCAQLATKIRDLPLDGRLLIPTGYQMPDGGHATLLEVIKTSNSPMKFSVHSYNTGEGANIVGVMVKDLVKQRFRRMSFSEVPVDVLLTGHGGGSWLRALLEPDWLTGRTHTQQYNMEFVHKVVFPTLAPYFNKHDRSEFFTAQTSGTCAWRSIMAWLHFQLAEASYKPFVSWQKGHVLLLGYSQWLEQSYEGNSQYALTREVGQEIEDYMTMPSSQLRLLEMAANEVQHHIRGRFLKHVPKGAAPEAIASEYKACFVIAHTVKNFVQGLYDALALRRQALNQLTFDRPLAARDSATLALLPQRSAYHPVLGIYTHAPGQLKLALPTSVNTDPLEALSRAVTASKSTRGAYTTEQASIALCRFVIETMPSLEECRAWPASKELLSQIQALNASIVGHAVRINKLWTSPWTLAATGKLLALTHHMACLLSDEDLPPHKKGLLAEQKFSNFSRLFFTDRYALVLDPTLKRSFDEASLYWDSYAARGEYENFEQTGSSPFFTLAADGNHSQVRFWHRWIESLSPEKQLAANVNRNPLRSKEVLALMSAQHHDPSHPAYPINLLKHAINTTRLLYDRFIQAYEEYQGDQFTLNPIRSLSFNLTKGSDNEIYAYTVTAGNGGVTFGDTTALARSKDSFWPLSARYRRLIEQTSEFSRQIELDEETPILTDVATPDTYLTLALRRGQTESLQNPSVLLYYLSERMSKLDEEDLREVFFLSFFKSTQIPSQGFESALAECLSSPAFVERLKDFLEQAFTHYIDRQAGAQPSHDVCMFLSIVSACCRYVAARTAGGRDVLADLSPAADRYLETKINDQTPEGIRLQAHLARVLTSTLGSENPQKSSETALIHWIKYNSLKGKASEKYGINWFQHLVSTEFYQALPQMIEFATAESLHLIAQEVFGDYMSPAFQAGFWHLLGHNTSSFKANLPGTRSCLIMDFAKGTLANEMGVLSSGQKPSWFETPVFNAIFGNEAPEYTIAGQYCLIRHKGVSFRALFADLDWLPSFQIQEPDSGQWLYYAHSGTLITGLPQTFAKRFWFFYDPVSDQLHGFSRDKLKKVANVSAQHGAVVGNHRVLKIADAPEPSIPFAYEGGFASPYASMAPTPTRAKKKPFSDLVFQIESPQNVEIEETLNLPEPKRSVFLPRFQSWGGAKLRFNEVEGKWYYGHSKYYLDFSEDQPALLGRIHQYVSLINDKGERLVLLPVCHWINKGEALGSDLAADIYPDLVSKPNLLDGTIHFMEFHVADSGKLNGGSLEARLYIAMIWYLQKQFQDAFAGIVALPSKDLTSKAVKELVLQLALHAQENRDFGPESLACLVAFCSKTPAVLNEIIQEEASKGAQSATLKWMLAVYGHYVRTFDRMMATMKLSGADELELARFLSDKGSDVARSRIKILEGDLLRSSWTVAPINLRESKVPMPSAFNPGWIYYQGLGGYYYGNRPADGLTALELTSDYGMSESYSLIDQKSARLFLSLRGASSDTLDHLKLFVQTQTAIQKVNPWFLTLLAILIACEEAKQRGALPISAADYELMYNHIQLAAQTVEGNAFLSRSVEKRLNEESFAYNTRVDVFRSKFHTEVLPPIYQKISAFLPRRLRFEAEQLPSSVAETGVVHGHHRIEWYQPANLRHYLGSIAFPEPSFSPADLRGLFDLTPFDALELPLDTACAKAVKDSETAAVEQENALFLEDLRVGQEKIESRSRVTLVDAAVTSFIPRAHERMETLQRESKVLETRICSCLNKLPSGEAPALLAELAGRDHGNKAVYGMREAVFLFLKGQKEAFLESNSLLSEAEIATLMKEISHWLMLQTDFQHLVRIEKLRKDYEKHKETISGAYYAEMLQSTCESKREYDPRLQPELLVFEYLSKMRLRVQQADLIRKMLEGEVNYNDSVAQLIMGGGKTSVLATVLLVLAAEKGLAIFVTPASQFSTVKENLAQNMRQCFDRGLVSLEIERSDLDVKNVANLYRMLQEAIRLGKPVIAKPETLQMLELEFVTRSERLANTVAAGKSAPSEDLAILSDLAAIGELIKERGQVLIDEVDLVLDTLKEVNFPGGVVNTMTPDRVEIMSEIFAIMADSSVQVIDGEGKTRNIKELLKVHQVLQGEFDVEFFKKYAIPVIARKLAMRLPDMKLAGFENDFVKYACGLMKKPLTESDTAFLDYMRRLSLSSSTADVDAVHQIALAKHVLQDVLTTTLTRSCGRNYGRTRGEPAGKAVPYQGVDTPSVSEFGYHIEAACYQFQIAMQTGIQASQLVRLAQVMTESATKSAERTGKPFNQTPEALEFLALTSIELNEAKFADKLDSAVQKLEKERNTGRFTNILKIEAETILTCVNFHAHRVSSGPQSFLSMFASRRAFSGTPWNVETYPSSMKAAGAYLKDLGTEGQIIATMLSRANDSQLVHSVSKADPVEMIQKVMERYPDKPERVSMLLDPSGLFKGQDNKQVAFAVRNYLESEEALKKAFKGVLFFTRPPKGQDRLLFAPEALEHDGMGDIEDSQATPDTLAFLPMGSDTILYIKGTRVEELEKHGLHPGEYFVIDDERHTTGTDILMSPDAVAVMTMDESLTKPRMCQAIMRLRQYLYTQDLHVMMLEETLKKRNITEPTMADVVSLSNRAQALQKYRIVERSFTQKIDNLFRSKALGFIRQAARSKDSRRIERVSSALRPFMTYEMSDDPYHLFGGADDDVDTIEYLKERFENRLKAYRAALIKIAITDSTNWAVEEASLLKEAQECRFLPARRKKMAAEVTGVEQEVEVIVQVEVAEEIDESIENEREIMQDLEQIQGVYAYGKYRQKPWTDANAQLFLSRIRRGETVCEAGSSTYWRSYAPAFLRHHKHLRYQSKNFHEAFADNFMCTENFQYTCTEPLPMFHPKLKPTNRILITRRNDGSYAGMLLSLEEAQFWQKNITEKKYPDVWLLDPSGKAVADHLSAPPVDQDEVKLLLLQMNAILGNVDYLNKNKAMTIKWLSQKAKTKIEFVKYAVLAGKDAMHRRQFAESEIFNPEQAERLRRGRTKLLAQLQAKRSNAASREQVQSMSQAEIAALEDEDSIKFVSPEQVNWLRLDQIGILIEPEQVQALNPEKIEYVSLEMVPHLLEAQIPHLGTNASKLGALVAEQANYVSVDQVNFLSPDVVSSVTKPELIQALDQSQLRHIKAAQMAHILPSQMSRLPVKSDLVKAITRAELLDAASIAQMDLISAAQLPLVTAPATVAKLGATYANELSLDLVKHLTRTNAIQALGAERVNALDVSKIGELLDTQILQITNDALIASIRDATLLAKLNLAVVGGKLSQGQLNLLPTASVSALPARVEILSLLDDDHFGALSKAQIQILQTKELVARLKKSQLSDLLRSQFKYLSAAQVTEIEGDAINAISADHVNSLRPEQIRYLSEQALIQALDVERIGHLKPTASIVAMLTDGQLGGLIKPELIALVDAGRFALLSDEGFEQLSAKQLENIQPHAEILARIKGIQVQSLSTRVIESLDRQDLLEYMLDDQLEHVSEALFENLSEERIQRIESADLLDDLSAEQLTHIQDSQLAFATDELLLKVTPRLGALTQARVGAIKGDGVDLVKHLTQAQLDWLAKEVVAAIADPADIQRLSGVQIKHLTQSQVKHLIQDQLSHLEKVQVSWLIQDQVSVLPQEQIKHLVYAQAAWAQDSMVKHLAAEAVNGISPEKVVFLTDDQVSHLNEQRLVSVLATNRVDFINTGAVKHLTDAQLPYLSEKTLVSEVECSDAKLGLLSTQALSSLVQKQVLSITDEDLLARLPSTLFKFLKADQVKLLKSKDQISHLDSPQVDQIDAKYVHHLTDAQLALLTDPALIKAVDFSRILHIANKQYMSVAQLEALVKTGSENLVPNDRFDELSPAFLQMLQQESVQKLTKLNSLVELLDSQMSYLTQKQVILASSSEKMAKRLLDYQLSYVPKANVPNLTTKQMGLLSTQSQIWAIPNDQLVKALREHQVGLLSEGQVGLITEAALVKKVPAYAAAYLSSDAWKYMTEAQIREFMISTSLVMMQIEKRKENPAKLVPQIPVKFFEYISANALDQMDTTLLQHATADQKHRISPSVIKGSDLHRDLLPHLLPEQMAHIPSKLCSYVKGDGVAYLSDTVLPQVTADQVQSLQSAKAVNLFCQRAPKDVSLLTQKQVAMLENVESLDNLDKDQLPYLDSQLVKKAPLSKLWTQPIPVLKKCSPLQKMALFMGLFMQAWILSITSVLLTLLLAPLLFFRAVRGVVVSSWQQAGYSWRCFSIF